jgi:hypothetical protein
MVEENKTFRDAKESSTISFTHIAANSLQLSP